MIEKLEHENEAVARQIHKVFQHAYKIEAQLLGVSDFPPLSRAIDVIQQATTLFYGVFDKHCIAAVIEIELTDQQLDIHSLTVDPEYFRRGFANQLIRYVLDNKDYLTAIVETAVGNFPAIQLYKKHGFIEYRRWTPSHGIPKLAMSVS
ncbi:GNAT family N-acetyltransferase [uncultured Shewanella sp.]|uniref:GNAT family N-acetyltransferase n=1 Tax=uncultured Shewanella sp. TaxID=173975 RepID=UPI00260B9241|nr:GNAT family N-acetyltransferase [uncultured Shewanella sp.]